MQGLEALAPVPAAALPGKRTPQTSQSGAEFASELEALEAQIDAAPESADEDSADSFGLADSEAEAGRTGGRSSDRDDVTVLAEPEDPVPARGASPDALEDGTLDWQLDAQKPSPRAELVQVAVSAAPTSAPPAPGAGAQAAQTPSGREPASPRVDAPEGGASQGRTGQLTAGLAAPAVLDTQSQGAVPQKGAGPASPDAPRPSSVSEIALNAGLRLATSTSTGTPVPSAAPAPGDATGPDPTRTPASDQRAPSQGLPAGAAPASSAPPSAEFAPRRVIRTEPDTHQPDPSVAMEVYKAAAPQDAPRMPAPPALGVVVQPQIGSTLAFGQMDVAADLERPAELELASLGLASGSDGLGRATATSLPAALQAHGPGVAQQIAAQIGAQIAQQGGGTTEIVLDPQELGRVSLSLSTQDGGITVAIAAERPETAELIRRHLDGLSQELRQIGYADVNVGFADLAGQNSGAQGQSGDDAPGGGEAETAAADPAFPASGPGLQNTGAGLDLRL